MEAIGLPLDLKGDRMFVTDFGRSVFSANLDGSHRSTLLFAEGNFTGIAYAEVPSDIEPLDILYVKDGGPHQALPRCLKAAT